MRVKQFVANDMSEIMRQIKDYLGPDAVILNTENNDGKFVVTAALEDDEEYDFSTETPQVSASLGAFNDSRVRGCLAYHEVSEGLSGKILAFMRQISREKNIFDDKKLLVEALKQLFVFKDILDRKHFCKLFMGTPGAGKSTAIAKTAALARFNKMTPLIISTDNMRAGANKQLQAFAEILEVPFFFAEGGRRLYGLYKDCAPQADVVLVDTPGINPFKNEEAEKVCGLCDVVKCDCFITMDAGRNISDAIEISGIFKEMGAGFLLPTRLDLTRRIGAVLSAAYENRLAFCAASVSASIAKGLTPITAETLAELILA